MILFRPEHVAPILAGTKTETRRLWPKGQRVKVGSIHLAKTKMLSNEYFAKLQILDMHQERLGDITDTGAQAEGYANRGAYLDAFARINHQESGDDFVDQFVYVVKFKVQGGNEDEV